MPPQKPPQPQKRKRGGQSGNQNAFKHGFYSRLFKHREGEVFSALSTEDIQEEIKVTRINNRRVLQAISEDPDITYDQMLAGVRAISMGTALIASLNRAALGASLESSEDDGTDSWLYDLFGINGTDD
jgi:two-component sensor histidine kinase